MSSLFSTGTSALLGYQRSLATIGNNVANANTPGYSRQVAELATRSTPGVQVQDVKRMNDSLATSRLLDSTGELSRLERLASDSGDVDTLFSDNATNLSGVWSNFFDSLSALGTDPSSTTTRKAVLQNADALVTRFKQLDANLDSMGSDVNATLKDSVAQINDLTRQIAQLNKQVVHASSASLEVLDKRDALIEKLVGFTGGNVVTQDDGSINVYTGGGQALVVGTTPISMTTVADPYRPERLNLALVAPGQTIPVGDDVLGGKLGGVLEFRSSVLDPATSELGRLAVGLADGLNRAQHAGVDSYGDRGADLFTLAAPSVGGNALNTGTATLAASVADPGQLDGYDVVLSYDGVGWSATRADTGAALSLSGTGTAADPLAVNGVALAVSGVAAAGDRFLLQPTAGAAGTLGLGFSDAGRVAAALAVKSQADVDNIGSANVANLTVTEPDNAALQNDAEIQFIDATQYTLDGAGPFDYAVGDTISANGWSFTLDGEPAAGDIFTLGATGPGSSDNRNLLQMASLDQSKTLDGGTTSLNAALSSLTTQIASSAAQAGYAHESEQAIYNQALSARDSISGVNLDEEAADMIKYQQAYQAAAKIIASADNIFQTLLQAI